MAHILTLTMNPAIDTSTSVDNVQPARKLRCGPARRDPGGGGVNVARVAARLGADVTAIYPAGGVNGQMLQRARRAGEDPRRRDSHRRGNARGLHGPRNRDR